MASGARPLIRLVCAIIVVFSTVLALDFDSLAYKAEIKGNQNIAPGDYLEYRASALAAEQNYQGASDLARGLAYPPPFLVFVKPFAHLSMRVGYIAWVIASLLVLALCARWAGLGWGALGVGLVSPPVLFCAICGQSGMLVSAFCLLAYGFAGRRPWLSGAAAGCVIIKPQFGLLFPICFLALRVWRSIVAAIVAIIFLAVLTTLCFGWGVWFNHGTHRMGSAVSLLSVHWFAKIQTIMVSPYVLFQSFGASLPLAGLLQIFASLAAVFACWRLWRGHGARALSCLAPSLCLTILATPYAYLYDMPALAMATANLAFTGSVRGAVALTAVFAVMCLYAPLSVIAYHSFGALLLVLLLVLTWPVQRQSPAQ